MPSAVLFFTYVVVMTAALWCFVQAFRTRFDTPVHKRWGITGCLLSLGGIAVVLVLHYALGWTVDQRFPESASTFAGVRGGRGCPNAPIQRAAPSTVIS